MLKGKCVKAATKDWRNNKIYVIGPCIVHGFGVRFEESFIGLLQKKIDECYPGKYTKTIHLVYHYIFLLNLDQFPS